MQSCAFVVVTMAFFVHGSRLLRYNERDMGRIGLRDI